MKTVRIQDNVVVEVIPDYALPVEKWYGEEFAANCVEAPDEVDQRWVYDPVEKTFSEPVDKEPETPEEPSPTIEDLIEENKMLKAQIQAQSDRSDFIEDCIAEMAMQVYN